MKIENRSFTIKDIIPGMRLLVVALTLLPAMAFGQADIHFSQFYETSILRNPALTGVFENDYKVGAYYRNQWSTISYPFETYLGSFESHVPLSEMSYDFFSFGLLAYSDKAGSIDQKITSVYPAVNYNKSLNQDHNSYLSVGFTGGHMQYSFDPGKATFNNQFQNGRYDPHLPSLENLPNAKMSFWDLGAGINYNTSSGPDNNVTYVVGFSGYHFTQPKFSYYQVDGITQNMRWNINAALGAGVNEALSAQIHANFAMQGAYREIMAGGLVTWTHAAGGTQQNIFALTAGAFYRYGDAAIPVIKVRYNKLALGVSYDVNVSNLKDASNMDGGYEMTLFFIGDYSDKSGLVRKKVCPKF